MQYKLYRESSNVLTKTSAPINSYSVIYSLLIVSFISIMIYNPGWISLIFSVTFIAVATFYLRPHLSKKPLYLIVTENEITYFSDERSEMVTVTAGNIDKIKTSFCKMEILTKDNTLHCINLMNIKTPHTRWEIKEITRRMANIS